MATESKGFFSGMLGKAEKALSGRKEELDKKEAEATGRPPMSSKWIETVKADKK